MSVRFVDDWPRGEAPDLTAMDGSDALAFHRAMPEYAPTPLHSLPGLARQVGVRSIWLKDESHRFGLRAFKGLGASYAIERLLREGEPPGALVTATDGNHGRAVAWAAARQGLRAVVFLPEAASSGRAQAIAALGAEVRRVAGTYDTAVSAAEAAAEQHGWALLQDSAWEGYDRVPRWVMQGYLTMLEESLESLGPERPTHVLLQCGVGSFAAAMTAGLVARLGERRPRIVIVEPLGAACGLAAAREGAESPPMIEGDLHTFMACRSCGRISTLAWPILRHWADAFVAFPDETAASGMRTLARPAGGDPRVESGESGAATTGALMEILGSGGELADRLALGAGSRVLLFSTEGATDPEVYSRTLDLEAEAPDD